MCRPFDSCLPNLNLFPSGWLGVWWIKYLLFILPSVNLYRCLGLRTSWYGSSGDSDSIDSPQELAIEVTGRFER